MAINAISTGVRNTMCNGLVDAYDAGSTAATGIIRIYDAGFSNLLAELNFSNPAYGAAAVGVATANAITDEASAPATGVAAVARWYDRDAGAHPSTTGRVHEGTVGTSGADINLNTTSITTGDTVSITSATVTMPAG